MSEVLSQEWRVEHCEAGDRALEDAQEIADRDDGDTGILAAAAQAFAAIAQAHYAAANVRARVALSVPELRPKTRYAIPGIAAKWEIVGMVSQNMGETGDVELRLGRFE